jgi:topoisomerase-4 subunit B
MDPAKRTLLRIMAAPEDRAATSTMVENLMGKRPELRFNFIQENAGTVQDLDI